MNGFITVFLKQLLLQSPVLLVYLIGMVIALVFWRRCPSAGILVLLGAGLLFLSSVAGTFAFQYIIDSQNDWVLEGYNFGAVLSTVALVQSFIHALSLALLLAAAFVGRRGWAGGDVA